MEECLEQLHDIDKRSDHAPGAMYLILSNLSMLSSPLSMDRCTEWTIHTIPPATHHHNTVNLSRASNILKPGAKADIPYKGV